MPMFGDDRDEIFGHREPSAGSSPRALATAQRRALAANGVVFGVAGPVMVVRRFVACRSSAFFQDP
jgi:hypothetical protein